MSPDVAEPHDASDPHGHLPVLPEETLALLAPRPGATVADLTAGRGGHAEAIGRAIGPTGTLVLFDLDAGNLAYAAARAEATGARVIPCAESFVAAPRRLAELGLRAAAVLADLGFASNQVDDPERGLAFRGDGPLDMRLRKPAPGEPGGPTAADLIAGATEAELARIIFEYGEEPLARRIARNIAARRGTLPIERTADLVGLVLEAYGGRARTSRMHPATRTFMALRIAVNDEIGALRSLLEAIVRGAEATRTGGWLEPGAHLALIAFHSLEDRLVKRAFAEVERQGLGERLTRKPLTASGQEVQANPRARSAKLRGLRLAK